MAALDREKYDVVPVGITRDGRWLTGNVVAALTEGHTDVQPTALLPDPQISGLMALQETVGVATIGQSFEFAQKSWVERAAGDGVVNGATIDLSRARHVIGRLGVVPVRHP